MAGNALPLLVLAGGAAFLLAGGKKKSSTKGTTGTTKPSTGGGLNIPPSGPKPAPSPAPSSSNGVIKQPGHPPRGDTYDGDYWGSDGPSRLKEIRNHFKLLGYPVEVIPHPMNILGPKAENPSSPVVMENTDGTSGALGGGDDKPNAIAKQFQTDYNVLSSYNKAAKFTTANMGGLHMDGLVGPYTLNALRLAVNLPGGKTWQDVKSEAKLKGMPIS